MSVLHGTDSGPLESDVRRTNYCHAVRSWQPVAFFDTVGERGPTPFHLAQKMPLVDVLGRPLRNLRLSVTDRCNLRCLYCMPEPDYVWLPREDLLHFEEISVLADVFLAAGIDRFRLTG